MHFTLTTTFLVVLTYTGENNGHDTADTPERKKMETGEQHSSNQLLTAGARSEDRCVCGAEVLSSKPCLRCGRLAAPRRATAQTKLHTMKNVALCASNYPTPNKEAWSGLVFTRRIGGSGESGSCCCCGCRLFKQWATGTNHQKRELGPGSTYLLVEDGLGLATETGLLAVVTALTYEWFIRDAQESVTSYGEDRTAGVVGAVWQRGEGPTLSQQRGLAGLLLPRNVVRLVGLALLAVSVLLLGVMNLLALERAFGKKMGGG